MRSRLPAAVAFLLLFSQFGFGQIPSVQIKVKESSGFLGLGGPRIVEIRLSNEGRTQPLNSVNVNSGSFVYFDCLPAGDWEFDEGFVRDYLSTIVVEQNGLVLNAGFVGAISGEGNSTRVLLGYPKTLRVEQPFLVRYQTEKLKSESEFRVPEEFWPGYESLSLRIADAEKALSLNQYRAAIAVYSDIITNSAFNIFTRQRAVVSSLLSTFDTYLTSQVSDAYAVRDSAQLELKERITRIAGYRPAFAYVVDSLPQVPFDVPALDSTVSALRGRARSAALMVGSTADSLQTILDEQTVRWILRGSATGKRGLQYQEMIQAIAYGFASIDFADTAARVLVTVPTQFQKRLAKDTLLESFQTFVRICADRHQMRLTLFPVEFLPNLRKDSAAFSLPFYSMLKAVNDYYSGNFVSCSNETRAVLRSCFAVDLLGRFDTLRITANLRRYPPPPDAFALVKEAEQLESMGDSTGAREKYRRALAIAPDCAFFLFALGESFIHSGDSVSAISSLQQAYQSDTLYLSAYERCTEIYTRQGNVRSVIDVLTVALARGNDVWWTNFTMGQAFMSLGDPVSAVGRYVRALDLNPRSYETCLAVGRAFQVSKDYQKARDYFNRAIEIDAMRREAVDALDKLNQQVLKGR